MSENELLQALDRGDLQPFAELLESGAPIPPRAASLLALSIRLGTIGFTESALEPIERADRIEERDKRIWAYLHVRQASGHAMKKQALHSAAQHFNVSEATAKAAGQKWERVWMADGLERDLLVWPYWLDAFKALCEEVGADSHEVLSSFMAANLASKD